MLKIIIPKNEMWDEANGVFVSVNETTLTLEHSLVSISKWESKYHKTFLSNKDPMSVEEILYYIKCMTLTQNVDPIVYNFLTEENIKEINDYIANPMTATTITDKESPSREIITSELVYYWMFANQIPKECEKWHINRLITLIKIFGVKNNPPKKMSSAEVSKYYSQLNDQRRKAMKSKG